MINWKLVKNTICKRDWRHQTKTLGEFLCILEVGKVFLMIIQNAKAIKWKINSCVEERNKLYRKHIKNQMTNWEKISYNQRLNPQNTKLSQKSIWKKRFIFNVKAAHYTHCISYLSAQWQLLYAFSPLYFLFGEFLYPVIPLLMYICMVFPLPNLLL